MPALRIEHVQEGMELGGDVLDRNGQPLLRAGTVLSEKDLRRFKMWGVAEVDIAGEGGETDELAVVTIDPALLEKYQPEVRELFKHTNLEHPFIAQLFQECLVRYVKRSAGAGGGT